MPEETMNGTDSRKFVKFSHTFADPWAGESADDAKDVTLTYRFAKPTKTQIQRLQDKAGKNPGQASRNLVLDVVHPEDRQALLEAKRKSIRAATEYERNAKLMRFALSRGFAADDIRRCIDLPDENEREA